VRGEALAFWVLEPGAGEIRPIRLPEPGAPDDAKVQRAWLGDADLRRQLRHAVEERHVTRSGWSATADQISRVTAEAV
jgi:hypothetical protein